MDIETQLRLLTCLFLVVLVTYTITRNYYRNIVRMQDRYIEGLRSDYQKLEKENAKLSKTVANMKQLSLSRKKDKEDNEKLKSMVEHWKQKAAGGDHEQDALRARLHLAGARRQGRRPRPQVDEGVRALPCA